MDSEMMTGRYCPFPRQELKPNESKVCDTRVSLGQGMKPGYTGYIPGNFFSKKTMQPADKDRKNTLYFPILVRISRTISAVFAYL